MRILVVDDSEIERKIISKMVESVGHQAALAESGEAALRRAEHEDFDLILMDQRMPRMNGTECAAAIRELPAPRGQVPIIVISGLELTEAALREAAIDGFLAKDTLTREQLIEAVWAGLQANQARNHTIEAPMITHEATPVETKDESIRIPLSVVIAVLLGIPAMVASGAWYMANQAAEGRHLAEIQVVDAKRLTDALIQQGQSIKQTSDAIARLEQDQGKLIAQIDLRLTRMEAQMNFVVNAASPGRRP